MGCDNSKSEVITDGGASARTAPAQASPTTRPSDVAAQATVPTQSEREARPLLQSSHLAVNPLQTVQELVARSSSSTSLHVSSHSPVKQHQQLHDNNEVEKHPQAAKVVSPPLAGEQSSNNNNNGTARRKSRTVTSQPLSPPPPPLSDFFSPLIPQTSRSRSPVCVQRQNTVFTKIEGEEDILTDNETNTEESSSAVFSAVSSASLNSAAGVPPGGEGKQQQQRACTRVLPTHCGVLKL